MDVMKLPFELPSELNIYSALETRDALLAWATEQSTQGHDTLHISARDVAEVDGSGLQLLAALGDREHPWRLVHSSTAFTEACRTLGFGHWLDPRYLPAGTLEATP
jgi:ABC-type transporter Mla MlaB component